MEMTIDILNEMFTDNNFLITIIECGAIASSVFSLIFFLRAKSNKTKTDISVAIKKVSETLRQSSVELENIQRELEEKIQYVNKLNEKANQANNLLSLNEAQLEAIKKLLNQETLNENKKSFWKNVIVTFIFFILGAIASYFISRSLK